MLSGNTEQLARKILQRQSFQPELATAHQHQSSLLASSPARWKQGSKPQGQIYAVHVTSVKVTQLDKRRSLHQHRPFLNSKAPKSSANTSLLTLVIPCGQSKKRVRDHECWVFLRCITQYFKTHWSKSCNASQQYLPAVLKSNWRQEWTMALAQHTSVCCFP